MDMAVCNLLEMQWTRTEDTAERHKKEPIASLLSSTQSYRRQMNISRRCTADIEIIGLHRYSYPLGALVMWFCHEPMEGGSGWMQGFWCLRSLTLCCFQYLWCEIILKFCPDVSDGLRVIPERLIYLSRFHYGQSKLIMDIFHTNQCDVLFC